jgi:hypothetical protein
MNALLHFLSPRPHSITNAMRPEPQDGAAATRFDDSVNAAPGAAGAPPSDAASSPGNAHRLGLHMTDTLSLKYLRMPFVPAVGRRGRGEAIIGAGARPREEDFRRSQT